MKTSRVCSFNISYKSSIPVCFQRVLLEINNVQFFFMIVWLTVALIDDFFIFKAFFIQFIDAEQN